MPYYPLPIPAHVIKEVEEEERRQWKNRKILEQRVKNRANIQALCGPINAIYDSGTPVFTKANISSLVRQIDESGLQRVQTEPLSLTVSIAGIDGKIVDIPLQLGVKHPRPPHYPRPSSNEPSGWPRSTQQSSASGTSLRGAAQRRRCGVTRRILCMRMSIVRCWGSWA
jgi:hypothetical protein